MGWVKMATGLFVLDRGSITDDIDTSPTTMMRTGLTHDIKGHTETRKIHLGTSQEKERFRKRKELGRLGGKYETNSHSPRHRHHLNNRAYIITQRVVPERNENHTTPHLILARLVGNRAHKNKRNSSSTEESRFPPHARRPDGKGAHHDERRELHLGAE